MTAFARFSVLALLLALGLAFVPGCQRNGDGGAGGDTGGGEVAGGERAGGGEAAVTSEPAGSREREPAGPMPDSNFVLLETSAGEILVELNPEAAPISTANFLQYVKDGFYDGTVFHRVIPGFMIQGGGFEVSSEGPLRQLETRDPIENEWQNGLKNDRGTIAMARTADPDSATAQFYINHADNPALSLPRDGAAYAVFGEVISGMEVVDAIARVQTGVGDAFVPQLTDPVQMPNMPVEPVVIERARTVTESRAQEMVGG